MQEVVKFLNDNPIQYLATIGLDGKPKNRPFMFACERENKLWFSTNDQKDVYAQLQACPYVELTTSSPEFAWIRLSGKAVFINDMAVKEACMNISLVKNIYQTADNPIFAVFYLADACATIADFSGQPPKSYAL